MFAFVSLYYSVCFTFAHFRFRSYKLISYRFVFISGMFFQCTNPSFWNEASSPGPYFLKAVSSASIFISGKKQRVQVVIFYFFLLFFTFVSLFTVFVSFFLAFVSLFAAFVVLLVPTPARRFLGSSARFRRSLIVLCFSFVVFLPLFNFWEFPVAHAPRRPQQQFNAIRHQGTRRSVTPRRATPSVWNAKARNACVSGSGCTRAPATKLKCPLSIEMG